MAEIVKKVPKKLRDGEEIMVDVQILRWRRMLARRNQTIGTQTARAKKRAERRREARKVDTVEKLTAKKFFD